MTWTAEDNFNSYSDGDIVGQTGGTGIGTWQNDYLGTNWDVQGTSVLEGTKALKSVAGTDAVIATSLSTAFSSTGIVYLGVKPGASNSGQIVFYVKTSGDTTRGKVTFTSGGNIIVGVGSPETVLTGYSAGVTYWIAFEIDVPNNRCRAAYSTDTYGTSGTFSAFTAWATMAGSGDIGKIVIAKESGSGSDIFDYLSPTSPFITSQSYTQTCTETVTAADTFTRAWTTARVLSEAVTSTATFTRAWTLARTLTESATAAASLLKTTTKTLAEAITALDVFTEARAQASGPNYPSSGTNNTGAGTIAWSTPGNIVSDNGATASVTGDFEGGLQFSEYRVSLVKADGTIGTTNKATGAALPQLTYTVQTYGNSTDLWGETWTPADINDTDFGVVYQVIKSGTTQSNYLRASSFAFAIPTGATINGIEVKIERAQFQADSSNSSAAVDYINVKIYYTLSGNLYTQTYTEAIAAADTLLKTTTRLLSEAATAADSIIRTTTRTLTDTTTATDALIKTATRTFVETIASSDVLTALKTKAATLADAITAADSLLRSSVRTLSEATTAADEFIGFRGIFPTFSEVATAADTVVKTATHVLFDAVQATDSVIRTITRAIVETIQAADTFIGARLRVAVLSDAASAVDSIVRTVTRTLTEGISAATSFIGAFGRILSDSATATDTVLRTTARSLIDTITATDVFSRAVTHARTFADAVVARDTVLRFVNGIAIIWTNTTRAAANAFTEITRRAATWADRNRSSSEWDNGDRRFY